MTEIYIPSHIHIKNFITPDFCDDIIKHCEKEKQHLAKLNRISDYKKILQTRYSYISFHNDKYILDNLSKQSFEKNSNSYKFDIDLPTYFHYITYIEKGFFDWHCDLIMNSPTQDRDEKMRKLTLIILLNDDFEGGKFCIHKGNSKEILIPLEKGDAVLHPSFISHKVFPVLKGVRKTAVVMFTGPNFK